MNRRVPLLALVVALASLSVTIGLWRHERQTEDANLRTSFDAGVRQTAGRLEQRLATYEQMLRGAQGLFMAADHVDGTRFETYVDALLAGNDFAGLRSISYAMAQRGGGAEVRNAPIIFHAPEGAREGAVLGYDAYADPVRRAALQQARDSGRTAITGRLRLRTDTREASQSGFLMFMPVYLHGEAVESVALRRAHLVGWVAAAFDVSDLMATLYGESTPGLYASIHDGVDVSDASLVYRQGPVPANARFEAEEYVGFAGHTWTMHVRSLPEFEHRHVVDASQVILGAGAVLSLLLGLLTDQLATGRARAHDAAAAMTRELRAGEERYRRIVETANEGIWMTNAAGRILFVNPKMQQLLGHREQDMLGRPLLEFIDGEAPLLGATAPGQAAQETSWRRRDGSTLAALLSVSAIADPGGGADGLLGMLTDVTDMRQAEARRALLEAQLRESQKMQAIGTLAGGIAHDFNNIVAAILGNVALARQELASTNPVQRLLGQVDQAGVRARALVQQILAFSRVHPQPQRQVSQPLAPPVQESIALLRATLPANVHLEALLSGVPLHVGLDATQVQQIVMNLCTNALHAMPERGGTIVVGLSRIELDAAKAAALGGVPPGSHARLWVADDGSGMDEATRARVFEPFFTTKRTGQGTGLGLSVVHGIVNAHQGAIAVESAPGRGSVFNLYFPLLEARAEPPAAEPVLAATPSGDGQRVLYVDDDPTMLLMVEALLQRSGYRVTCVEGPSEALAAMDVQAGAFDLVVSDYNMPEYSGLELAHELLRRWPRLPVVITSGYITEEMRAAASRAGVRTLMQKEYTLEQLPVVVHAALQA